MKTLTLLRHAKSSWDDTVERDFDRPLNRRGHKAAFTIGREMRIQGLAFDLVLASPAARVAETLQEVSRAFGVLDPVFDERLYLAMPDNLLEIVRETADSVDRLLLVGHNPGLELLALQLSSGEGLRSDVAIKYPTATLAEIVLPVSSWKDVRDGIGTIRRFIRPRDLDPDLGPDEESY